MYETSLLERTRMCSQMSCKQELPVFSFGSSCSGRYRTKGVLIDSCHGFSYDGSPLIDISKILCCLADNGAMPLIKSALMAANDE